MRHRGNSRENPGILIVDVGVISSRAETALAAGLVREVICQCHAPFDPVLAFSCCR
jgi:hypothetical protein